MKKLFILGIWLPEIESKVRLMHENTCKCKNMLYLQYFIFIFKKCVSEYIKNNKYQQSIFFESGLAGRSIFRNFARPPSCGPLSLTPARSKDFYVKFVLGPSASNKSLSVRPTPCFISGLRLPPSRDPCFEPQRDTENIKVRSS